MRPKVNILVSERARLRPSRMRTRVIRIHVFRTGADRTYRGPRGHVARTSACTTIVRRTVCRRVLLATFEFLGVHTFTRSIVLFQNGIRVANPGSWPVVIIEKKTIEAAIPYPH